MTTAFSYTLSDSADLARTILRRASGYDLDRFSEFLRAHQDAKRTLGNALCPETWRRSLPFTFAPEAGAIPSAWRNSLTGGALRSSRDTLDKATAACAALSESELSEEHPTRAAAQRVADNASKRYQLFIRAHTCLLSIACHLNDREYISGTIADNSGTITVSPPLPGVRKGQRLTRAISAYLREAVPLSADEASSVVDLVTQCAEVKPRAGTVTLSANLLDYVLSSENTTGWCSCHSLARCHCAGVLQYAVDDFSLVATYSEKSLPQYTITSGAGRHAPHAITTSLPVTQYRQMIYTDLSHHSASCQRQYPSGFPESLAQALRKQIASLLISLRDGRPIHDVDDAHWTRANVGDWTYPASHSLSYPDNAVEFVQLTAGREHRPVVSLEDIDVLCPHCGSSDDMDAADSLVCASCKGGSFFCTSCEELFRDETDGREVGSRWYCTECFNERFSVCEDCNTVLSNDDARSDDNGNSYCDSCYSDRYTSCDHCGEECGRDDMTDVEDEFWCSRCVDRHSFVCFGCEESFDDENGTVSEHDDETRCSDCHDEHEEEHEEEHANDLLSLPVISEPHQSCMCRSAGTGNGVGCLPFANNVHIETYYTNRLPTIRQQSRFLLTIPALLRAE